MRAGPTMLLALLIAAPAAHAAKVYRCPDGSYADKPCGEGQRVVTTTKRHTVSPDADRQCVALADDAEDLARGKAEGVTVQRALKQVDESGLPYEKRTQRKKFVVKVYQAQGSAAEVRSIVEADCVTEKKAEAAKEAEQRAAAARAAKEQALNTTPRGVSPGGSSVSHEEQRRIEQCESVKSRIESLKKQLRAGGSADTMDDLRDDESAARRQLSALCP